MAITLRLITILIILLVIESSLCDGSKWKEILLNKNFTFSSRNGRISNGQVAARNQFPFVVILFNSHTNNEEKICSGSIISATFVLSAAHCFENLRQTDLLAGVHDVTLDDPAYELRILPADITDHPKYNSAQKSNDISIVSTRRSPFKFTGSIQPIVMAPRSFINANLAGLSGRVAGWGLTVDGGEASPVLNFIDLPIITNAECATTFGSSILDSNFCFSGANRRSTCPGDSGGGSTIAHGNSRVLIGIVSFGSKRGCQLGFPTVQTRITAYYNWITSITGIRIS